MDDTFVFFLLRVNGFVRCRFCLDSELRTDSDVHNVEFSVSRGQREKVRNRKDIPTHDKTVTCVFRHSQLLSSSNDVNSLKQHRRKKAN